MTQSTEGLLAAPTTRCRWCGRPFSRTIGPGRPRQYCRRSCRQRDFEARARAREVGLGDDQLVVARRALAELDELAYVLSCAVEDVDRQLAGEHDDAEVGEALQWLLEAARPIAARAAGGALLG